MTFYYTFPRPSNPHYYTVNSFDEKDFLSVFCFVLFCLFVFFFRGGGEGVAYWIVVLTIWYLPSWYTILITAQFFCLFYHLLACANTSIMMDATLHIRTVCLSVILTPCVFYNHYATQYVYCHNTKALLSKHVSSLHTTFHEFSHNYEEHIWNTIDFFSLPQCTFFV